MPAPLPLPSAFVDQTQTDLNGLLEKFHGSKIQLVIEEMGALASHKGLLNKVRGAFGRQLINGACHGFKSSGDCRCTPSCAANLFFSKKPTIVHDGITMEIAKPYVLAADLYGDRHLALSVTLFGHSITYAEVVQLALAQLINTLIDWPLLGRDLKVFVPPRPPRLLKSTIKSVSIKMLPAPDLVQLCFKTGIETNNRSSKLDAEAILTRILIRPYLLSPWFGCHLMENENMPQNDGSLNNIHTDLSPILPPEPQPRGSNRTGQHWISEPQQFDLTLAGNLTQIWPALLMGEKTHIGRSAVTGLGRYTILRH